MNVIEELEQYFDSHAIQSAIQTYTQYQNTRRQAEISAHQIKLEGLNLEQVYATLQATWTQEYRNELIENYRTNWEEARNRWKSKFNEDHGNNSPGPGTGGGPN